MSRTTRVRYEVERVLALLCGLAFLLSIFVPEWIELLTGTSPDSGDGSAEWALSIGLLVGSLCSASLARRTRRALRAAG
jgi:Na+/H+ antiporter NhaA